jgi:hypothetical protein
MHTEHTIQNALYYYLCNRGFQTIFPNMDTITMYEADILAITKTGYAYEYEIKTTLSDFRADLKKRGKHASLSGNTRKIPYPYGWGAAREVHVCHDAPDNPYEALRHQCFPDHRPKEFWYVINGFDVPENELPDYAGLMRYATGDIYPHKFEIIKQAPRLESQKVSTDRITHATRNMLYRYWIMRIERRGGRHE